MFVGKPTLEEVLERIRSLPHEGYWLHLLTDHGLPEYLFTYRDHSEYIEFCQHMDVDVAQIKVIKHPSIPVTGRMKAHTTIHKLYADFDRKGAQDNA
jgi:hypothetical protein